MATFPIHSTPLYVGVVDNIDDFNKSIEPIVVDIKQNMDLTNPWGDNTETSYKNTAIEHQIKSSVFEKEVINHIYSYCSDIAGYPIANIDVTFKESWVNFSNRGSYQHYHTHPVSDLSGVYYYKANKESKIDFQNTNIAAEQSVFPFHFCGNLPDASVLPETGMIIMFPSWLRHAVYQNNTDNERISITFNVKLDR